MLLVVLQELSRSNYLMLAQWTYIRCKQRLI